MVQPTPLTRVVRLIPLAAAIGLIACDTSVPTLPSGPDALASTSAGGGATAQHVALDLSLVTSPDNPRVLAGSVGSCAGRVTLVKLLDTGAVQHLATAWEIDAPNDQLIRLLLSGMYNPVTSRLVVKGTGELVEKDDDDMYGLIAAFVAVVEITGLTSLGGDELNAKFGATAVGSDPDRDSNAGSVQLIPCTPKG